MRVAVERIVFVTRGVFAEEVIAGVNVFKLANLEVNPTFVNSPFVDPWRSHGFEGLDLVTGGAL